MKISRILHAGYLFSEGDTTLLFDPIFETPFSHNCFPFPEVEFKPEIIKTTLFSAVFISHYHDDHCSLDSLKWIQRTTPIYLFCVHPELAEIIRAMGFTTVTELTLNSTVSVGNFKVHILPALDTDVDSIFHIEVNNLNILNVVDSWISPSVFKKLRATQKWDIILWPFQTLREIQVLTPSHYFGEHPEIPPEWIEQIKVLNPRILVPSSCQFRHEAWSWYNKALFPITYDFFQKTLGDLVPHCHVVKLNPGTGLSLTSNSYQLLGQTIDWINPIGDQNLDFEYDPFLIPDSTAEIAKNFPEVTAAEKQKVLQFCEKEILNSYADLDASTPDSYFSNVKIWKLILYTHSNSEIIYFYKVQNGRLFLLESAPQAFDWLTEIPMYKLYQALTSGETLTSLYMRINDHHSKLTEPPSIADIDVLEDPLIRCLFNRSPLTFQTEQWRRLTDVE